MAERVIAIFEKNSREQVRVLLGEYKGREVVNIRVFWTRDGSDWFPSTKGITLSIDKLPKLAWALSAAVAATGGGEDESLLSEEEKRELCHAFKIGADDLEDELEADG